MNIKRNHMMKNKKIYIKEKSRKRKLLGISIKSLFFLFILGSLSNIQLIKNELNINKNEQQINTTVQALSNTPKFTVVLDPGHGGYDVGTKSSSNIFEKDIALEIALKTGEVLEKNGIKVLYTRTTDKVSWPSDNKLDLRARVKVSNEAKADVFVSIHCNGADNSSYNGIETWCRFPNSDGEILAKSIQKELVNSKYSNDRGLKYESNGSLAVLKLNNSVSALVEVGFLTNSSDANFITSKSGQDICANDIAKGILNYKSSAKN